MKNLAWIILWSIGGFFTLNAQNNASVVIGDNIVMAVHHYELNYYDAAQRSQMPAAVMVLQNAKNEPIGEIFFFFISVSASQQTTMIEKANKKQAMVRLAYPLSELNIMAEMFYEGKMAIYHHKADDRTYMHFEPKQNTNNRFSQPKTISPNPRYENMRRD